MFSNTYNIQIIKHNSSEKVLLVGKFHDIYLLKQNILQRDRVE